MDSMAVSKKKRRSSVATEEYVKTGWWPITALYIDDPAYGCDSCGEPAKWFQHKQIGSVHLCEECRPLGILGG